ncbi:MAG: DNA-3-methyladenine glycosylase [Kiloniellales bacterium]|nr:DNA-3-methyladenine glycosylase [Kiloniellales bacterium]
MDAVPTDEGLRPALEALAERDRDMAAAYAACGLPPVRAIPEGFAGLIHTIVGQQVSAAAGRAIMSRLEAAVRPMTPQVLLKLDDDALRRVGLSGPKVRYCRGLAEDLTGGRLDLAEVHDLDDAEAIERITRVKGLGRWSAECYLLFALKRPDIWPADDLAVQAAVQRLKRLEARPTTKDMDRLAEPWRPYRSAAARFLWHYYRHPGLV